MRANALAAMRKGPEREKTAPFLPQSAPHLGDAERTLRIMEQAPAVISVTDPAEPDPGSLWICTRTLPMTG